MGKKLLKTIWKDQIFSNIFSGLIIMVIGYFFVTEPKVQSSLNEAYLSIVAPDIVRYSGEFQNKAASEIESGLCPTLTEIAKDHLVMRDQSKLLKSGEL